MRRALLVSLVSLALVAAAAAPARADDAAGLLARARGEVEGMRYDVAQATLARALEAGDADRDQLIAIYRLAGEVAGALDQGDAARQHFAHLLALAPDARLDPGVSPKIAAPFADARKAAAARGPLQARESRTGDQLVVEVTGDPLRMVARARAYLQPESGVAETRILDGQRRWALPLPAGTRSWSVALLDRHGNQLLVLRGEVEATAPPPPPPVNRDGGAGGGPAWYARWHPWAGLAVGLGIAGTAMGLWSSSIEQDLENLNATSPSHEFSEAQALERKGRRVALTANLCFAGAGAAAVVGTILFIRGRGNRARTELAATPVAGGALLVLGTEF